MTARIRWKAALSIIFILSLVLVCILEVKSYGRGGILYADSLSDMSYAGKYFKFAPRGETSVRYLVERRYRYNRIWFHGVMDWEGYKRTLLSVPNVAVVPPDGIAYVDADVTEGMRFLGLSMPDQGYYWVIRIQPGSIALYVNPEDGCYYGVCYDR